MEKYFRYTGEYISGNRYWWRCFLQSFLSIFLIGIYLIGVTTYTRAKSLGMSNTNAGFITFLSFAGMVVVTVFRAYIDATYYGTDFPYGLAFFSFLATLPHFYLLFKNGTPPKKIEGEK